MAVALALAWLGCSGQASAKGTYDPKTGQFHLSYTYARLPNTSNDAEALLSAEEQRTPELDALVASFYQVISADLGRLTGGRGYLAPPDYTSDVRKADVLISPDTPFTLSGGYRGGWGTLNGFSNNIGQLAIYIQSLKQGGYTTEGQRLTVVHELCHYLFGLPDEYGSQACPAPGAPGGKGCLMDNYNSRTWPGFLCNTTSTFRHNPSAVTTKDPNIAAEKSCQEIVDDFFAKYGVDKNARFSSPTGKDASSDPGSGTISTAAAKSQQLSADLTAQVRDKARSLVEQEKATGQPVDKKNLVRKLSSSLFTLLKDSGLTKLPNLELLANTALELAGVPPVIPETLEKLAPLFEAEAKRLAQSLPNNPSRKNSILTGLLQFANAPGSGNAPPTIGDEEYAYIKALAQQVTVDVDSDVVDPATAQFRYLSQVSAKLDQILILNNVPGAIEARDLSKKLDSAFAARGVLPSTDRDDPFKKARATLVIAPPMVVPQYPGSPLDRVVVHPGDSHNYNEIRFQSVTQFDNLVAKARVEPFFGIEDLNKRLINRTGDLKDFRKLIRDDSDAGEDGLLDVTNPKGRFLVSDRTRRIRNLLAFVYDEIRKDTIQNVVLVVPPGGLPLDLIARLEAIRSLVIGHSDLRLDIVQLGTAPIPRQLRDFAIRSDGAILTVTDQDEVGAVSQRLANDQSQGTWVNVPIQGTIAFRTKEEYVDFRPPAMSAINYSLFQRTSGDRIGYPIGLFDALNKDEEIRLPLRPFYVDAGSAYQFVAGFTTKLKVPTDPNNEIDPKSEQNGYDKKADNNPPALRLVKTRIDVTNAEDRARLAQTSNRSYREAPADNLTFNADLSSRNVLVFNIPSLADGGVSEGWYTPVLVLKKEHFENCEVQDFLKLHQGDPPNQDPGLHFTFSIGTPRSNAQLIPRLIQDVPVDPNGSYLGILSVNETKAVVKAQMIVGAPVKGALVRGFFERVEVGATPILFEEFEMSDDGQAPDKVKDDGVYTGSIPLVAAPRHSAEYRVVISAEHQAGTAYIDLAESIQITGKQADLVKDRPVPKFQRATSLNFRVEGELGDVTLPTPTLKPPASAPASTKQDLDKARDELKEIQNKLEDMKMSDRSSEQTRHDLVGPKVGLAWLLSIGLMAPIPGPAAEADDPSPPAKATSDLNADLRRFAKAQATLTAVMDKVAQAATPEVKGSMSESLIGTLKAAAELNKTLSNKLKPSKDGQQSHQEGLAKVAAAQASLAEAMDGIVKIAGKSPATPLGKDVIDALQHAVSVHRSVGAALDAIVKTLPPAKSPPTADGASDITKVMAQLNTAKEVADAVVETAPMVENKIQIEKAHAEVVGSPPAAPSTVPETTTEVQPSPQTPRKTAEKSTVKKGK